MVSSGCCERGCHRCFRIRSSTRCGRDHRHHRCAGRRNLQHRMGSGPGGTRRARRHEQLPAQSSSGNILVSINPGVAGTYPKQTPRSPYPPGDHLVVAIVADGRSDYSADVSRNPHRDNRRCSGNPRRRTAARRGVHGCERIELPRLRTPWNPRAVKRHHPCRVWHGDWDSIRGSLLLKESDSWCQTMRASSYNRTGWKRRADLPDVPYEDRAS